MTSLTAMPLAAARFGAQLVPEVFREGLRIGQERAVTLGSLLDQMDFLARHVPSASRVRL